MRAASPALRQLARSSRLTLDNVSPARPRLPPAAGRLLSPAGPWPPRLARPNASFLCSTASTLAPSGDFADAEPDMNWGPDDFDDDLHYPAGGHFPLSGSIGNGQEHPMAPLVTERPLSYEADVLGPPTHGTRLVDLPEGVDNFQLWLHILEFRIETGGDAGVSEVLDGLLARQALRQVDGPAAREFWNRMLTAACPDESNLFRVYAYAERLDLDYGLRWPNLYRGILSYFLRQSTLRATDAPDPEMDRRAVQWHLRLQARFGLDESQFVATILDFISATSTHTQSLLQNLYLAADSRTLYDKLVPYLWQRRNLPLARRWRRHLIECGDLPVSSASKPFLNELHRRFSDDTWTDSERLMMSEDLEQYRVQPHACNDALGARMFASSWVPVEFSISSLAGLGVNQIGPLTLQAIALRLPKQGPYTILKQIQDLEKTGVSIGTSTYSQAIRFFAVARERMILRSLLHTDIHPDVFEDRGTQLSILGYAISTMDWATCRAIVGAEIAATSALIASVSNHIIETSPPTANPLKMLNLLEGMVEHSAKISPSAVLALAELIRRGCVPRSRDKYRPYLHSLICSQLMKLQCCPPSYILNRVLKQLGKTGQFEQLVQLSMQTARLFDTYHRRDRGELRVYYLDMPLCHRQAINGADSYRLMSRALHLRHPWHPLQFIFDKTLKWQIIKWGFMAELQHRIFNDRTPRRFPVLQLDSQEPKTYRYARGVRLLRMLRSRGVFIDGESVRQMVYHRIAEFKYKGYLRRLWMLDNPRQPHQTHLSGAQKDHWTLIRAKALFDLAWHPGGNQDFLPNLESLKRRMKILKDQNLRQSRRSTREVWRPTRWHWQRGTVARSAPSASAAPDRGSYTLRHVGVERKGKPEPSKGGSGCSANRLARHQARAKEAPAPPLPATPQGPGDMFDAIEKDLEAVVREKRENASGESASF